ncbi:hypothetical protein [Paludibacterium sp.]|uniref:hypothetical protein n=1 Tax=Paludibacterium sp. TaxID=1917523 RepID=UPI0025D82E33|nr:hypothetical protein [Paludibacterium sp.]MBV8649700.1 hypothetical protein [Paludibacterium sp.]
MKKPSKAEAPKEIPTEEQVMHYLARRKGVNSRPCHMALSLRCETAALTPILESLQARGLIHKGDYIGRTAYMIPTEAQLAGMQRAADRAPVFTPLRIDPYRETLYARLQAQRAAIPSIG